MPVSGFGRAYDAVASSYAHAGATAGRRAENQVQELESRCNRLALVCEAMWTLLRDELKISDEQLLDRINEVDLADGQLDGKVKRGGALECHSCNRMVSRKFAKCMYCGAALAHDPFG